jgi:hypothetical protein
MVDKKKNVIITKDTTPIVIENVREREYHDVEVIKSEIIKPNENKGIVFNIIKYFTAMLPVIIPFIGIFYLTNDIIISIFVTFILDVLLIVAWSVYLFKNPNVIESYKK